MPESCLRSANSRFATRVNQKTEACNSIRLVLSLMLIVVVVSLLFGTLIVACESNRAEAAGETFSSILNNRRTMGADEAISRLRQVHNDAAPNSTDKKTSAYVLARELMKKFYGSDSSKNTAPAGTSDEIVSLLEEASVITPLFERCQWHICQLALRLNEEQLIRASLEAVAGRSQSLKTRIAARYGLAQSYVRGGESERAQALFLSIRKESPGSPQALGSGYYLGETLLAKNSGQPSTEDTDQAAVFFREYIKHSADGRFAITIAGRLQQLAEHGAISLTADDREALGQVYFANAKWIDAIAQWEAAGPEVRPFSKSIALTNLKKYEDAKAALLAGIKLNPESKHFINAATQLSHPLNKEQTIQLWKDVLALNPKHADAPLWNIATRVTWPESRVYFQRLLKNHPTSEFAPESVWWIFWNDIKDGKKQNYPAALTMAQAAIARYPTTKAAGRLAFWSGKIHERTGNREAAKKSYETAREKSPNYYYGFRAEQKLKSLATGKDTGWSTAAGRPHPHSRWVWPEPHLSEKEEVAYGKTFAELAKLRQFDECLEILPSTATPAFKSWLLAQDGLFMPAIGAAIRHINGKPKHQMLWQMSYPLAYAEAISQNARDKSVDPFLVHALVREESRYNYQAISRSHALGLMQLLPGTAYGVAKRIGVPLSSQQDILTPEINIKLGTDYLAYAIRRFDGNCMLAVASYNGGPGAVSGWMKKHTASGVNDFDVFVENIPYRETRDYVRKVFGSYWAYNAIYGTENSQPEPTVEQTAEESPPEPDER